MHLLKHCTHFNFIPLTLLLGVTLSQVRSDQVLAQTSSTTPVIQCKKTVVEKWINQLQEGNTEAFDNLVNCGSQAVPTLIEAINHEDETIRIVSIAILGEIGTDAAEAIAFLEKVLEVQSEDNKDARIVAVNALGNMGKQAIPALITALNDKDFVVRGSAAEALGNMGKEAKLAASQLLTIAQNSRECKEVIDTAIADSRHTIPASAVD